MLIVVQRYRQFSGLPGSAAAANRDDDNPLTCAIPRCAIPWRWHPVPGLGKPAHFQSTRVLACRQQRSIGMLMALMNPPVLAGLENASITALSVGGIGIAAGASGVAIWKYLLETAKCSLPNERGHGHQVTLIWTALVSCIRRRHLFDEGVCRSGVMTLASGRGSSLSLPSSAPWGLR